MFNGRRQPSRGGTSRMTREYQVRFCERLGVKFPGPTRQLHALPRRSIAVRFTSMSRLRQDGVNAPLCAVCGRLRVSKDFLHVADFGRCSHVFGLFVRLT